MKNRLESSVIDLFFRKTGKAWPEKDTDFYNFVLFMEKYLNEQSDRILILENCLKESSDEIKDYVAELKEKSEQLSHSNRLSAIGEMSASLSHEINNPLFVISGNADIIKTLLTYETGEIISKPKIIECLDKIEETTNRIKKITISLKKISNEANDFVKEVVNLRDVIIDSTSLYTAQLANNNIRYTMNLNRAPADIKIASVELTQVLINLITNAKQAVEKLEDPKEKYIHIDVSESENGFVFLSIINGGPAIPVENRKKIFESFFTTKPVGEGTGLGLSLSKKIIKKMGGDFYLDEEYPSPKFVIKLPIE